ncbi:hypothetical protein D3C80_1615780 [compost metagenome]
MVLIDVGDHRWFDKETRPEPVATAGNGCAAFTTHVDIARDPLLLAGRDQWPHLYTRVQAIAEFHGAGNAGDIGHDIVEVFALHIQPGTGTADLTLVKEDGVGGARCGTVQVGVGHDDSR